VYAAIVLETFDSPDQLRDRIEQVDASRPTPRLQEGDGRALLQRRRHMPSAPLEPELAGASAPRGAAEERRFQLPRGESIPEAIERYPR
jgi:hypothetical protein